MSNKFKDAFNSQGTVTGRIESDKENIANSSSDEQQRCTEALAENIMLNRYRESLDIGRIPCAILSNIDNLSEQNLRPMAQIKDRPFAAYMFECENNQNVILYFDITQKLEMNLQKGISQTHEDFCAEFGYPIFAITFDTDNTQFFAHTSMRPFLNEGESFENVTCVESDIGFEAMWMYLRGYSYGHTGIDILQFCSTNAIWFLSEIGDFLSQEEQEVDYQPIGDREEPSDDEAASDETYAIKV